MDYEKKYKEALERAQKAADSGMVSQNFVNDIFALESEDERIRKMLIDRMERWKKCAEDNNVEQDVKDASAALSYLEKQKERKPAEINVNELLAADRLASAEMTGRLKERSEILENPEKYGLHKPAEWSEKDERIVDHCIGYIEASCLDAHDFYECVEWLKSLRPKPHWYPSKEQMGALENAYNNKLQVTDCEFLLSLYLDLQKYYSL